MTLPAEGNIGQDPLQLVYQKIQEIMAASPGATWEDAIRLLTASAIDPEALEQWVRPNQETPQSFMGAPILQMPGAEGYEPGQPAVPPMTSDEPILPKYPPIYMSDPTPSVSPKEAEMRKAFAALEYPEGQGPPSPALLPLGFKGAEIYGQTAFEPHTDGPAFFDPSRRTIRSPTSDEYMKNTKRGVFAHELAHAFQNRFFPPGPELDSFVEAVIGLAKAGDQVAQDALGWVETETPLGIILLRDDPQHLYTYFVDKIVSDRAFQMPETLKPFYEGLFDPTVPIVPEGESEQEEYTAIQQRAQQWREEVVANRASMVLEASNRLGGLHALLSGGITPEELSDIVYSIWNDQTYQTIRDGVPDPETVKKIEKATKGLPEDIASMKLAYTLIAAGIKVVLRATSHMKG